MPRLQLVLLGSFVFVCKAWLVPFRAEAIPSTSSPKQMMVMTDMTLAAHSLFGAAEDRRRSRCEAAARAVSGGGGRRPTSLAALRWAVSATPESGVSRDTHWEGAGASLN